MLLKVLKFCWEAIIGKILSRADKPSNNSGVQTGNIKAKGDVNITSNNNSKGREE